VVEEVENNISADEEAAVEEKQIITFKLGDEIFGLDITDVERITQLEPITIVPRAPEFISGIMNLAGSIITLVDLSKILGIPEEKDIDQVIILENEMMNLGILTGFITDVITVDEASPDEGLVRIDTKESNFISGVFKSKGKIVNVLNTDKLFDYIDSSISVLRVK
jgi:purine-binding chemotaxis protein CheW